MTLHYKDLIPTVLVLVFFTSLPQIYVCLTRGSDWNGAYANLDMDEYAYSAYLNALIDGRPRRNDPYTRNDSYQNETLFSIQFLPAYALAVPARILGLSASWMFIILVPIVTTASAIVVFRLLSEVTGNVRLAATGSIGILVLGTIAAVNPLQVVLGSHSFAFFPFLRRYMPAGSFPVFFAMTVFVWRGLTRHVIWIALASLSFAVLVFSYFFLWTAALAWFVTIVLLWFVCRPEDRRKLWKVSAIFAFIGAAALLPYAWLLTHRAATMDRTHILELTHYPDFFRGPEVYALLILIILSYKIKKRIISLCDPKVLFAGSFALVPFIVFNQQILTGHSLQPFHYEHFIANYCVVLAAFLAIGLVSPNTSQRILTCFGLGCSLLGLMIGIRTAQITNGLSSRLDEGRAVALHLRASERSGVVFGSNFLLMDTLPTTVATPVLWAPHLSVFSNLDSEGQKKRFFQCLYYIGLNEEDFSKALHSSFVERIETFGAERADPALASTSRSITEEEIRNAARQYGAFVDSFDESLARDPILSYAIVSVGDNLSNLDRWYQREEPKRLGDLIVYRLTLKK